MSSLLIFPGPDTSINVVSASLRPEGSRRWETFRDDRNSEHRFRYELFREGLVALKRDVSSLVEHMKCRATNIVQDAAGQIKRRVRSLRQEAGAQGDRVAKAINLFIENQPVAG